MRPIIYERVENFFVVGMEYNDGLNRYNFGVSRYGARNTFYASSFSSMARQVRARLRGSPPPVIGELVIMAHGSTGLIQIGSDEVSGDSFNALSGHLSLLRKFVAPGFTHVKLFGCRTGADDTLIKAWSRLWLGTPVSAAVKSQWTGPYSLNEGWEGQVRTAFVGGVFATPRGPYDLLADQLSNFIEAGGFRKWVAVKALALVDSHGAALK